MTSGRLTARATREDISRTVESIRRAAQAGVDLVQVRERRTDDRSLIACVTEAIAAIDGTGARLIVNDRVDVALAAAAAGVQLRGDSIAAPDIRTIVPAGFLVGRSVHSAEDAAAAEQAGGCDYLVFGTVFPSPHKPAGHPVAGVEGLARTCRAASLPVLAIGGITVERIRAIARAGAAGAAGITLFGHGGDVAETVRGVRRLFDT